MIINKNSFLAFSIILFILVYIRSEKGTSRSSKDDNSGTRVDVASKFQNKIIGTLSEDSICGIAIPFGRKEMLDDISQAFKGFQVAKEIGQQDGPDFPLYSVKSNGADILYFSMDWEDTLKLDQIYVKSSSILDEYGLKVGDSFQDIKKKRSGEIKIFANYHMHIYTSVVLSNIMYEIEGIPPIPDTTNFENLQLTEEQVKNWKIRNIIWRNPLY